MSSPIRRPGRTSVTKQKLFDATLRLVGTHGLAALTVDEIAAEAGVAKGTVYYNFRSKDGLIEALLRYGVELLGNRLRAAEQVETDRVLESLVDSALGFIEEYPSFAQLLVGELWRTTGQWHETLTLLREDIVLIIQDQMRRIAATGRMPQGADLGVASSALFGTILVVSLDWQVFQPERSRDQVREAIMLLVRALRE